MFTPDKQVYNVLVADDSDDDRFLIKRAMQNAPRLRLVAEVCNGDDVIAYLGGDREFMDRSRYPLPHLLLLDLKMPRKDGFEVLQWLQQKSRLDVTVVALTDSMEPAYLKRALDLGADLFQVKPRATHDRNAMILALEDRLVTTALKSTLQHPKLRSKRPPSERQPASAAQP